MRNIAFTQRGWCDCILLPHHKGRPGGLGRCQRCGRNRAHQGIGGPIGVDVAPERQITGAHPFTPRRQNDRRQSRGHRRADASGVPRYVARFPAYTDRGGRNSCPEAGQVCRAYEAGRNIRPRALSSCWRSLTSARTCRHRMGIVSVWGPLNRRRGMPRAEERHMRMIRAVGLVHWAGSTVCAGLVAVAANRAAR